MKKLLFWSIVFFLIVLFSLLVYAVSYSNYASIDTFDRADSATLGGSSETGRTWVEAGESASCFFEIITNRLHFKREGLGCYANLTLAKTNLSNHSVFSITMLELQASPTAQAGIIQFLDTDRSIFSLYADSQGGSTGLCVLNSTKSKTADDTCLRVFELVGGSDQLFEVNFSFNFDNNTVSILFNGTNSTNARMTENDVNYVTNITIGYGESSGLDTSDFYYTGLKYANVTITVDTTLPKINTTFNISVSAINFNSVLNYSCNATDNTGLRFVNSSINMSGIRVTNNATVSGTSFVLGNNTERISVFGGSVVNFTCYATDTSNNQNQNSTLITINDNIFPAINATFNITESAFLINKIANFSCNASDENGLLFINSSFNLSGVIVKNNASGLGRTSFVLGNNTQSITTGVNTMINWTCFATDNFNNKNQNSTLIIVNNSAPTPVTIVNGSDKNYNKNITINWTASDADLEELLFTVWHRGSPISINDLNFTTSFVEDGTTYYINISIADATMNQSNQTPRWNATLDVSTPTMSGMPDNGTSIRNATSFFLTSTDNLALFEANCSLYNSNNRMINSTNITNITITSFLMNVTLNTSQIPDGIHNLTCWVGDTKNIDLPIDFVKTGFDGTKQQFNDTISGLQINTTFGLWLPNDVFYTISENDNKFNKKSSIINKTSKGRVEHFEMIYDITLPTLASLNSISAPLSHKNINFSIQIKTNQPLIELNDLNAPHYLIGNGKNRLSYDAQDLIDNGYSNLKTNKVGGAYYLTIPPRNDSYENGMKLEFKG